MALGGFVNIFDPEVIVIGGGVAKAGDLLLEQARVTMESLAMTQPLKGVRLMVSDLGDFGGALGMIARLTEAEGEARRRRSKRRRNQRCRATADQTASMTANGHDSMRSP